MNTWGVGFGRRLPLFGHQAHYCWVFGSFISLTVEASGFSNRTLATASLELRLGNAAILVSVHQVVVHYKRRCFVLCKRVASRRSHLPNIMTGRVISGALGRPDGGGFCEPSGTGAPPPANAEPTPISTATLVTIASFMSFSLKFVPHCRTAHCLRCSLASQVSLTRK